MASNERLAINVDEAVEGALLDEAGDRCVANDC